MVSVVKKQRMVKNQNELANEPVWWCSDKAMFVMKYFIHWGMNTANDTSAAIALLQC